MTAQLASMIGADAFLAKWQMGSRLNDTVAELAAKR